MSADISNTGPRSADQSLRQALEERASAREQGQGLGTGQQFHAGAQGDRQKDPQTQQRAADFALRLAKVSEVEDLSEEAQGLGVATASIQGGGNTHSAARAETAQIAHQITKGLEGAQAFNPLTSANEVRIPIANQAMGLGEILVALKGGEILVTLVPLAAAALSSAVQAQIAAVLKGILQQRFPDKEMRVVLQNNTEGAESPTGFNPLIPGRGYR